MCGKSSLKKLRTEGGWGSMPSGALEPLEAALTVLEEDLKSKKEEKKDMHRNWAAPGMLEHPTPQNKNARLLEEYQLDP